MGRGKIFIVEDDKSVIEKIKKHLGGLGYEVIDNITTQECTNSIKLDDNFTFNNLSSQLMYNNEPVNLSKKERLLLKLFISRANQLISNETLEYEIWLEQLPNDSRRRTLVSRLRSKLDHRFIATYASEGYIFHLD